MSIKRTVSVARYLTVFLAAIAMLLLLGPLAIYDGWDKFAHAGLFYGFTLLTLMCLPWSRKDEVFLALIAVAAASEISQRLTGRSASTLDLLADMAGVAAAAAPVYVARFRQVAQQGSARHNRRKASAEAETVIADISALYR